MSITYLNFLPIVKNVAGSRPSHIPVREESIRQNSGHVVALNTDKENILNKILDNHFNYKKTPFNCVWYMSIQG